jgi:predicted esterase
MPLALLTLLLAHQGQPVPRQPYLRYTTQDAYNRTVTYYLSEGDKSLPLAVYIQGSGHASLFIQAQNRIAPNSGHATIRDALDGKTRLLIVEKPGVNFLDTGATPIDEPALKTFRQEHSLERWTEAVKASIKAAKAETSSTKLLVIGHSEGGRVAAKLAHDLPEVTHVAILAGGGPTHLYDLARLARAGSFYNHVSPDPLTRESRLIEDAKAVMADPTSTEKLFLGHPYLKWSTWMQASVLDLLKESKAKVFIGHGEEDRAMDVTSSDMLYAELTVRGKDVVYARIPEADHSFKHSKEPNCDGWLEIMQRIRDWFQA